MKGRDGGGPHFMSMSTFLNGARCGGRGLFTRRLHGQWELQCLILLLLHLLDAAVAPPRPLRSSPFNT